MRIAIFGDVHGHWSGFREEVLRLALEAPLDLVLQVGDAQPIRDDVDLAFMPVPEQYRHLGSYAKIQEPWPVPTLFIGGNHEPWNRLAVLPDGGFLQPNLEYLGRAGQRSFGTLSVAGLSGVFSPRAFDRQRQRWPFLPEQARDASYYRREDLANLPACPVPTSCSCTNGQPSWRVPADPIGPAIGRRSGSSPLAIWLQGSALPSSSVAICIAQPRFGWEIPKSLPWTTSANVQGRRWPSWKANRTPSAYPWSPVIET